MAALVVILLLTGAIYVIFERRIERPIQHLLASAEKIADGDLTAEVTSEHDDELGRLAAAISTMAEASAKSCRKSAARARRCPPRAKSSRAQPSSRSRT
ncbi:MAG: HAMP domain-containing protein [Veillonellaceae bacterium]|nr:HAMP domain-containing protein [Veillonellaceae bacterium]